MELDKAVKALGIGLSRLLRYSYGGFLLIALSTVMNRARMEEILKTIPWELAAITAVVLGAGIYAAHRSLVIPGHHWSLCGVFWVFDRSRRISAEQSSSPTRWLANMGVRRWLRILAYSSLRRSETFLKEEERERLNVAHAENGLVIMMAEGFTAAAVYGWFFPNDTQPSVWVLGLLAVGFWVASYPAAWLQHSLECLHWRSPGMEDRARQTLTKLGFQLSPRPLQPIPAVTGREPPETPGL